MTFSRMILLMLLSAPVLPVAAAPQEREWPGLEKRHCGAELDVISADETLAVHYPPREFFSRFESIVINQGEMLRNAVALKTLFDAYGAESVRITDCERGAHVFNKQAADGYLLVKTGKGVLKLVRHVEGRMPVTLFRFIRVIDFSGPMITKGAVRE